MRKKNNPSCKCCPPPLKCYWVFPFVGCSGVNPPIDGVTWSMSLGGTVIASGVGNQAWVDSTSLTGGPLVLTASKTGFVSRTATVLSHVGACTDPGGNNIFGQFVLTPDPAYTCCPTKIPGTDFAHSGCADPIPNTFTLGTGVGLISMTYSALDFGWFGSVMVPAVHCNFDAYGNCIGTDMSGLVPFVFFMSCSTLGVPILGCGVSMSPHSSLAPCAVSKCDYVDLSCSPSIVGSYIGFSCQANQDAPYTCWPKTFTLPDLGWVGPTGSPLITCPNPAGGPCVTM